MARVIDWTTTWTAVGSIGTCAAAVGTWWFGGHTRRAKAADASPRQLPGAVDVAPGPGPNPRVQPSLTSPDVFVPILARYFCEHCGYPFERSRQFCQEHKLYCAKPSEKPGGCKNRLGMDITDRLTATLDPKPRDNQLVALRWAQQHYDIDNPEQYIPPGTASSRI